MSAIPVLILTGFLGSGKTTLLNHLLAQPALADTAVIINEYGDVGIDHLLVRHVAEDVVLLASGCICCTVKGELQTALRDLALKRVKGEIPEFRRLILETTGLADPAPIMLTLATDPFIAAHYRLDGVVTVVDAVNGLTPPESVKQVALADRLIVTKTDLTDGAALAALIARVRTVNPSAPLTQADHGKVDAATVLEAGLFGQGRKPDIETWLGAAPHDHDHNHDDPDHHHGVQSFVILRDQPVSWPALAFALEMIAQNLGDKVLRVKGIVFAREHAEPLAIHGVGHIFHLPAKLDPDVTADHSTRLVFITRGVGRETIDKILGGFLD